MKSLSQISFSKQKVALYFKISLSTILLGAVFKFMHWPYGWPLIAIGAVGTVLFHSIQFYQKQDRAPLDYSRLLLIVSFSLYYLFSIFQLQYGAIFIVLIKAALVAFLILYVKEILFPSSENGPGNSLLDHFGRENLSYLLSDLATVYIVVASLFKILHWEFGIINGNVLLVIGLLSALVSILASPKDLKS
ncbi:hypothetical protein N9954_00450 [Maribacter sp.]|nr:hypothetical protein [Maribacter sp.]